MGKPARRKIQHKRHPKVSRKAASHTFPKAEKAFSWSKSEMRKYADPLADSVIAAVSDGLDEATNTQQVNAVLSHVVKNDQIDPVTLGQAVPERARATLTEYLTKSMELPADVDEERLLRGEGFFAEHGPIIVLLLMCKSMPQCYGAKSAAEVLAGTGRMSKCLKRRMVETGQFLIDAMSPGGLRPGGRGIASAQKVRLMHAAIRYHVTHHTDYQDVPASGTPINQEDMIATLLSFSCLVTDGMTQLGIPYTAQEAEDYLYSCNVMGYLLGVREDILPRNMNEARAAWKGIVKREYAPSAAGQELTAAMVELLEATTPGTAFDMLPLRLMRYLTGDKVADLIKLPRTENHWGPMAKMAAKIWVFVVHDLARRKKRFPLFHKAYDQFSLHLLDTLERTGLDGQPATFHIPDACRANWNLAPNSPAVAVSPVGGIP